MTVFKMMSVISEVMAFLGYIGVMGSTHYGKYYSYVKNPNQQIFILTEKKELSLKL
ncbi:MAG: PH domain-containing protein [Bacteroides caccae]